MRKLSIAKGAGHNEGHCADTAADQPVPDLLDPSHGEIP